MAEGERIYFPWTKVAPTLGVIFLSPAILTVGSTLGTLIPFWYAVIASVVAAVTISILIYFHGGVGARVHLPFAKVMESSLGVNGSRFLASPLILITQVGWYSVLVTLGGESLVNLTGYNRLLMITVFGVIIASVTYSGFTSLSNFTKITASVTAVFALWSLYTILHHQPSFVTPAYSAQSLLYDVGLAIGGATSISTVSPDFLRNAKSPRDVKITAFAVVLPLALFTLISGNLIGAYTSISDPVRAIALILPLLANLLLLVGSCASASSLYPPTLALSNIVKIPRKYATIPAAAAGLVLAYIGIVNQLPSFLDLIGILLPPLIGINLAEYYPLAKGRFSSKPGINVRGIISWAAGAAVGAIPIGIYPLQALLVSFVMYYLLDRRRSTKENPNAKTTEAVKA